MLTDGEAIATRSGEKEIFRPDIEGLRGLAILLILIYHAGLLSDAGLQVRGGFIGVDLFFVVSGFLITGLLIRERERTGRTSFSKFYARRVRRILPAAAVVLLITIPISYALLTPVSRPGAMQDGAAAALSVANVRFALTIDYFNTVSFSPFLHYWSLGVEEQFYLVWPAMLAVVAWRKSRVDTGLALVMVIAASFAANLFITYANPAWAFYMLPTRAWQLAAGGLLAVGTGSLAAGPAAVRALASKLLVVLGWIGFVALAFEAVVLDSNTTPYPGMAALVPTLASVLLIASGTERYGPGILLRVMPVRFVGKISYSLYLWHWPILILGGIYLQGPLRQSLEPRQALALVALSILIATISWMLVEEPFRRGTIPLPRPSRVVAGGVAAMLVVSVVSLSFGVSASAALTESSRTRSAAPPPISAVSSASTRPASRASLVSSPYAISAAIRPPVDQAATDFPAARQECLAGLTDVTPKETCVYGNASGSQTVALVGDSHALALFPAVEAVAQKHGWRLRVYLKAGCPFIDLPTYSSTLKRAYTECDTWNQKVVSELKAAPPFLVLVSISRWDSVARSEDDNATSVGHSMGRMISKMPATSRVAIIQDPPLPGFNVPVCLSANLNDYRRCAYTREVGFNGMATREQIASSDTGTPIIDLTAEICPGTGDCPVVIENVIVWRDEQHLTATFAATLAPALDADLTAILAASTQVGHQDSFAPSRPPGVLRSQSQKTYIITRPRAATAQLVEAFGRPVAAFGGPSGNGPPSATYIITRPPSTARTCPVMYAASSEARNVTALAMSSTVPKWPSGVAVLI